MYHSFCERLHPVESELYQTILVRFVHSMDVFILQPSCDLRRFWRFSGVPPRVEYRPYSTEYTIHPRPRALPGGAARAGGGGPRRRGQSIGR